MARIIQLRSDPHQEAQALLPWYANGTLDPSERELVQGHLEGCPECRADLEANAALASHVASLPTDIEEGWAALRAKMAAIPPRPRRKPLQFLRRPVAIGWALAGQLAAAALILGVAVSLPQPPAEPAYRVLGTSPSPAPGNIILLFRPDATEQQMRAILTKTEGRLVDGPTASGAYVVRVPEPDRPDVLKQLRAKDEILLAEPIDSGETP